MTNSKFNVVLIDDERDLLEVMKLNLQEEFHVKTFTDPLHAMSFLESNSADAIVLDYHIPGRNAFEIYAELRTKKLNQPVLFLTGEMDISIKLDSLNLGVDDFLHKPINSSELSAYLNNRIKSYKKRNPEIVKIHNLEVNLQDPHVILDGRAVTLTPKEFEILSMLVTSPNTVIKKSAIIETIWADVKVEENNIDTHMSNMRKKLKSFTGKIKTIKCVGYVLRV